MIFLPTFCRTKRGPLLGGLRNAPFVALLLLSSSRREREEEEKEEEEKEEHRTTDDRIVIISPPESRKSVRLVSSFSVLLFF